MTALDGFDIGARCDDHVGEAFRPVCAACDALNAPAPTGSSTLAAEAALEAASNASLAVASLATGSVRAARAHLDVARRRVDAAAAALPDRRSS